MERQFYSRKDTAELLGVSTDTVDKLGNTGNLKKSKIGSRTLYSIQEIQRFSEKLMREGAIRYAQ